MKQFIVLLIFILGVTHICRAQGVVGGYYIKNNKVISGIAVEKANRSQKAERLIIPNQPKHSAAVLYPSDIEEYGLEDGHKYVSADVTVNGNPKKVFLEEIVHLDSIVIYSCRMDKKDFFFLQRENNLPELIQDKEKFWNLFRNPSCPKISAYIDSKKKKELTYETINAYRRAYTDCNTNLLPKFRLGITTEAGAAVTGTAFLFGVYAQIPIDECFSFQPEILVSQCDVLTIQTPMLFRYSFNYMLGKTIPYIDVGLLLDIKTEKDKGILVESAFGQGEYYLANSQSGPFRYGCVLGGGIEHKYRSGHSLYAGIRFRYIEGSIHADYKVKIKCLTFNMAYSF